jgi:hypothetical protein
MTRDQWQDRFARAAVDLGAEPGEAAALAKFVAERLPGRCPDQWPKPEQAARDEMA